jgi:hypothetical protein
MFPDDIVSKISLDKQKDRAGEVDSKSGYDHIDTPEISFSVGLEQYQYRHVEHYHAL